MSRLLGNPVASAVIGTDEPPGWRRAKCHLALRLSRGPFPAAELASRAVFVSYKTVFLQRNMTNDSAKPIKQADFDRSRPIRDARLAALEELAALDQKLELEYGLTGNPMIKAGPCKAAKTDATQPRNGTVAEGSFRDSRNANEPMAAAMANEVATLRGLLERLK